MRLLRAALVGLALVTSLVWLEPGCLCACFCAFPHLDLFPTNTMADAEQWAADIGGPAYAIDEDTAIQVVDGVVEVVSEGRWRTWD